ncbi:hypothetical protein [Tistlia consotensis]|uniref:hypothetical protein n=1 Tax=Tistlia consotensis TaxID=1321365 RepID=UPI000A14CF3F|nr:hypothetical protein [Tistlia consotensis]
MSIFLVLVLLIASVPVDRARAIPPFARQTGEPCSACHTVYPQLTPFGRQFKLNGYTESTDSSPIYERLGAWLQGSFTHTARAQPGGAAPDFGDNDNFAMNQASLFYGGKLADKIGAFLQGTYDGVEKQWAWDNMDLRFADEATIGSHDLTYGVSLNNNPGVQDLWNSTPVWAFPFDSSALAPGPAASTLMEGGLGQIAGGGSVYGMLDESYYGEIGLYHTLSRGAIDTLAGSADGTPRSDGVAPYWRFDWQKDFGTNNNIAVGTSGLYAALYPDGDKSQGSDSFTDLGLDAQYQYLGSQNNVTARASLIHESQSLDASQALGGADNASNELWSFNSSVSYTYDQTWSLTGGVSHLWGSSDAAYYGTPSGSPDTTAFTVQGDWVPFNKAPISFYPWFNPRLSLQYVHYAQFDGSSSNVDGSGRSASDNDTLFMLMTVTF